MLLSQLLYYIVLANGQLVASPTEFSLAKLSLFVDFAKAILHDNITMIKWFDARYLQLWENIGIIPWNCLQLWITLWVKFSTSQ